MFLTWDVRQHDDDEAVVVVEGHVVLIGQPHGVHGRPAHERQSGVDGEQLPDDAQRVHDDEEVVSGRKMDTHTHTHVHMGGQNVLVWSRNSFQVTFHTQGAAR